MIRTTQQTLRSGLQILFEEKTETHPKDRNEFYEENDNSVDVVDRDGRRCTRSVMRYFKRLDIVVAFVVTGDRDFLRSLR